MELVRKILLEVETLPDHGFHAITVDGYNPSEISYHVRLLHEKDLLVAQDVSIQGVTSWKPKRLTYEGHDFLDSVRDESFWSKVKSTMKAKSLPMTIDAVKMTVPVVIKHALEG